MSFSKNIVWSPTEYKETAILAREAGEEMLSRLDWMTLKPKVIVDIGCKTGEWSVRLNTYYPDADVLAVDSSESMLQHAKEALQSPASLKGYICADEEKLPLANQSVDFVFANLVLPWHANVQALLREWRRILRPNGMLMFSALGLDTFKEWQTIFNPNEMPCLMDMHNVGDLLLQEKFADPVLDVNYYTMAYRHAKHLLYELQASGMWFPNHKTDMENVLSSLASSDQSSLEVTYEVIYAHAFIPAHVEENILSSDGTVRVSLDTLRQQLTKK